jgi:hypothetical protein
VLCSDGLSGQVKKEEIAREATSGDLRTACERLVAMANERGGPDNITVLIARCDGDGLRGAVGEDEVGHQIFPLIDTEANTDPVPVYRGSKPPVPAKQVKATKAPPPQQGRGQRLAVLGAVVLAVGALVGWQLVRGRPTTGGPARVAVTRPDSALLLLDRVADSVARAVRGYRERGLQFASHQVECPALAQELAQVEAVWVSYSLGKRRAAPLDPTRQSRDQTLDTSVDSVDRDFDRSGCPRP